MANEKKGKFIEGLVCKLNKESGEIHCEVDKEQYDELTKSVPPKRITFELKE